MIHQTPAKLGIRKTLAIPASIIAAATPIVLWNTTTGRTAIIRKLHIKNRQAGLVQVQIGTGLGGLYVQSMPDIPVVAGMDETRDESFLAIPNQEFTVAITVQASAAAAAPNDIQVLVEVEEFEGTGG